MNRALPNVFDLLQTTLIQLRRGGDVPEDETAFEELKESVVRTAAELSVMRDPHHKGELLFAEGQPTEAAPQIPGGQNHDAFCVPLQDNSQE